MAFKLSPVLCEQQFSDAGVLLSGGKIETYLAGSSTPATTYTTTAGTVAQSNPIILNSRGEVANLIYLTTGISYKFILKDSADNVLRTFDNIEGVNDSSLTIDQWVNSGVTPTYVNATQFTLPGDQTSAFQVGRRIKATVTAGTVYGYISVSAFAALTTITAVWDSGTLDSGLSAVQLGLLTPQNSSLPAVSTAQIQDLAVTSAKIANASVSNAKLAFDGGAFANRNRFINGAMAIDQRNNGASGGIAAGGPLGFIIDRWYTYCTGANASGQRVAGTSPNQFNMRYTGAALVTKIAHAQRIEAANCQDFAGTTATLSVDLANSLLTTVTWNAWYANTTDTFGTLAAPTRTLIATGTFTVTSTLTRYSTNIAIPATATTGIEIEFNVGAQTSGTWTIGRAQFENGATQTPFEYRPIQQELALCQRYYEFGGNGDYGFSGRVVSGSTYRAFYPFKVTKRAAATIVLTNNEAVGFAATAGTAEGALTNGFRESRTSNATTDGGLFTSNFTALAEVP